MKNGQNAAAAVALRISMCNLALAHVPRPESNLPPRPWLGYLRPPAGSRAHTHMPCAPLLAFFLSCARIFDALEAHTPSATPLLPVAAAKHAARRMQTIKSVCAEIAPGSC